MADIITKHWTVVPTPKSEKQERLESSLCLYIPGVPFNRWILFLASFFIQFCCGSLYSFSAIAGPVDGEIYGDKLASKAIIAFYIAVGMFGLTAAIMGPWLERNGPRMGLLVGSLTFGVGNAISAVSLHYSSIVGLYIGYGIFCGFGLGLNYISPVSALQKWFPDIRGVASGFAVCGFGAGNIAWTYYYNFLTQIAKLPTAVVFGITGAGLTAVLLICSIALRTPPNDFSPHVFGAKNTVFESINDSEKPEKNAFEHSTNTSSDDLSHEKLNPHYTLIESIKSPEFFFLYLVFFCNQLFGLVAISSIKPMAVTLFGQTADESVNILALNGIFNCLGRLVYPMISDLIVKLFANGGHTFHPSAARKGVFFFTLGVQIIIVGLTPSLIATKNYSAFRALMWLLTSCYGAGFGTIPAFLTDMWGPYNIGALHGIMLTAWAIAGVGGGNGFNAILLKLKAQGYDVAYDYNFTWILAVLCVGFFLLFFVRTNPKDRQAPGYRYSIFGVTVLHIGGRD